MVRILSWLLAALTIFPALACDAPLGSQPFDGPTRPSKGKADGQAPADVCAQDDLYADGLCDPGCFHPDPDCFDCATAARRAVAAIAPSAGRSWTEPLSSPDPRGKQLLRVATGSGTSFVVSARVQREHRGDRAEFCIVDGLHDERVLVPLLDEFYVPATETPPDRDCVDAAEAAVLVLEREHAMGVLGPDGTRMLVEGEDGRPAPVAASRIAGVELVSSTGSRSYLRVHVERSTPWSPRLEAYVVHTQRRPDVTDPQQQATICQVVGLQSAHERVDLTSW